MLLLSIALALFLQPRPPQSVSALIAEARAIAKTDAGTVWPAFSRTPFPVLLVGDTHSFLYCPAGEAPGFTALQTDPLSRCPVKTRARVFLPTMQATFAAVDGVPTVVIGMPLNTEKNEAAWISTLLHEHFHQVQMGAAGYQEQVKKLKRDGGDQSVMWMLNFPFPYQHPAVDEGFLRAAQALARALRSGDDAGFSGRVGAYRVARRAAFETINVAQRRYAEFQLWQEGGARYSEIALAEAAIERVRRGAARHDYSALAINLRGQILENLENFDLRKNARVSFYSLGAGEALLLDRIDPDWREQYFQTGLAMGPLIYGDRPALAGAAQ